MVICVWLCSQASHVEWQQFHTLDAQILQTVFTGVFSCYLCELTQLVIVLCVLTHCIFHIPIRIFQPSTTAFSGTGVFGSEASTGPIISDITELAQSNPVATEEWIEGRHVFYKCQEWMTSRSRYYNVFVHRRTSPLVHIKEEPSSPTHSPEAEEVCPVEVEVEAASSIPVDTPLSPTAFINSILQESEPVTALTPPPAEQKCLSIACLDK